MATTVRNIKKKTLPRHHFYAILAGGVISSTDSDVEHTLSKNLLVNNMYNTLYDVDDVSCVNNLVNDHCPVNRAHNVTNCPRCVVY